MARFSIRSVWHQYTPDERRNIALYIAGIMCYKFGLEAFNGSITTLAADRFKEVSAFKKLGMLQGLNQAFQCVGSICIAPLIKRFPTKTVLASAIMGFAVLTSVLLVVDATTGGGFRKGGKTNNYGSWNPDGLFPIYCSTGIVYGMVELIRRVIPRDIVGGDISKLRRMDATVHIFYEIAGTTGAIATTYLVLQLGNNYSFIITPICFTLSCTFWLFISNLSHSYKPHDSDSTSLLAQIVEGFALFFRSIYIGGRTVLTSRKYIWLLPGYSFALYGHRFLENTISPLIAKRVFLESAYSQILVSGSNLGELFGAFSVFVINNRVPTPMPWLRLDGLLLLIIWVTPYYKAAPHQAIYAWKLAGIFIPISLAWAAGDVSLAAYIQSTLSASSNSPLARDLEEDPSLSLLGAVMAFLYSTYIVLYAIISPLLGGYIDASFQKYGNAYPALYSIAGVQFSVLAGVVVLSSFVPRGSWGWNPRMDEARKGEGEEGLDVENGKKRKGDGEGCEGGSN